MPEDNKSVVYAVSSTQVNVPKLTGKNFRSWLTVVKAHAAEKKLEEALFGNGFVTEEADLQARIFLFSTLDDNHIEKVSSCLSALDMVHRLMVIYADNSSANAERLLEKFFEFKYQPGDTMSTHIAKLESMRLELSNLNQPQTDGVFMAKLLSSLPDGYEAMKSGWDFVHSSERTIPNLVGHVLKTEAKLKADGVTPKAFLAGRSQGSSSTDTMTIEQRKKITRCGKCGHKGHWHRECTTKIEDYIKKPSADSKEKSKTNEQEKKKISLNVGKIDGSMKNLWLCDSGASNHMCNNEDWFTELVKYSEPASCTIGNGEPVEVIGQGKVEVASLVEGEILELTLHQVLYIPRLPANLMSVGAADAMGIWTKFEEGRCTFLAGKQVVATGSRLKYNLYLMKVMSTRIKGHTALLCQDNRSLEEWHRSLGHASLERVKTLLSDPDLGLKVRSGGKEDIDCGHCPPGKGRHSSHPSVDRIADKPGVIHVDLSGKVNIQSLNGSHYYLVAKDEMTEFCFLYLLKNKAEVCQAMADLIVEFEVKTGYRVRIVNSDNGSEFINMNMRLLMLKEHIVHETSAPRTPQQNGRIEREIGSLTNMARTMLISTRLPDSLWDMAIETANYIRNRLPTKRSQSTPYERLMGRKPYLKHILPFGTEVHAIMNWDYRFKFDPRTEQGFLVGFTDRSNTYKVYLPSEAKVICTSDVIFRKHETIQCVSPVPCTRAEYGQSSVILKESMATRKDSQDLPDEIAREQERRHKLLDEFFSKVREEGIVNESFEDFSQQLSTGVDMNTGNVEARTDSEDQPPTLLSHDEARDNSRNSDHECPPRLLDCTSPPRELTPHSVAHSDQGNRDLNESSPMADMNPFVGQTIPRSPQKSPAVVGVHGEVEEVTTPKRPTTRSTRLRMPHLFMGALSEPLSLSVPVTFKEAVDGPNHNEWQHAIDEELEAHSKNGTWEVVNRPSAGTSLTAKWVFTLKRDTLGNVERFKARLVARGYKQKEGIDYTETFAPVVRSESIRILIAICAIKRLQMLQFDVSSAFLHGKLSETIFMEGPEGVELNSHQCLRLKKSLYGLKQAPRCWNSTFDEVVRGLGFSPTLMDPCIYVLSHGPCYLAVYVDDGLIIGPDKEKCREIVSSINKHFSTRTITGGNFLGMELSFRDNEIHLNQRRYIDDLSARYKLTECRNISSPLADAKILSNYKDSPATNIRYREIIGSLLYCAMSTRPDILYSVILLSRFSEDPREIHAHAALRVIKYLKSTRNVGLVFRGDNTDVFVEAYSDADWAGDPSDSKSTSGVVILLSGCPIVFSSRKQTITSLASAESEYVAACEAAKELEWMATVLSELKIEHHKPTLFMDNISAITNIKSNQISSKSKHIRLKFHYTRQLYVEGLFNISYISSDEQRADFLTKPLSGPRLEKLVTSCGVKQTVDNLSSNSACDMKLTRGASLSVWFTLGTLLVFSNVGFIDALKFERVQNLVWIPTDYRVDEGAMDMDLDYVPLRVCDGIGTIQTKERPNVTIKAYSQLRLECMRVHEQKVVPLIDELGTCLPPEEDHPRHKRFIWFLAGAVVTVVALAIIGAVVTAAVLISEANNKIEKMNERQERMRTELNTMKKAFEEATNLNNATAAALQSLAEKSETNRRMIEEFSTLLPEMAWNSASLYFRQQDDIQNLKEIITSCKNGRVATRALAELTTLTDIRQFEERDTLLTSVSRRLIGTDSVVKIEFLAMKRSTSTKVYKLHGFDTYMNLKTEPYLLSYRGPSFAIYNSTSNCTKGVKVDPAIGVVLDSCIIQNYRDPEFDQWERRNVTESEPLVPQVVRLASSKIVYCTYHNITISGEETLCPPFPISIPLNKNFTTAGLSHAAERLYLKGPAGAEKVPIPSSKVIEVDPEYIEQMALIQEVRLKNTRIRELLSKNSNQFPFEELELHHYLGLVSVGISLFSCVYLCLKNNQQPSEHVTVVNSSPQPVQPSTQNPTVYPFGLLQQVLESNKESTTHVPSV